MRSQNHSSPAGLGVEEARTRLRSLGAVILFGFLAVEIAVALWSTVRAPDILVRDDNPRAVEAELRIRRGQILDTNGEVLARTVGSDADLRRHYPTAAAGPAVGYYSFRHGTSGIEAGYDDVLRGNSENAWLDYWRSNILHLPSTGRDVRLTLDARWQRAADALMGDRSGAVILVSLPDAAIRAMVSHPGYDPNSLDTQFEQLSQDERAPLLNRATQGQYQPGLVLQPFVLAEALEQGAIRLNDAVVGAEEEIALNGAVLRCERTLSEEATWLDVLQARCPGPTADLGAALGPESLRKAFAALGLSSVPNVPLEAQASDEVGVGDPRSAAIGQDRLTVSPLQVLLAWVALANGGVLPNPQLVSAVQEEGGAWDPVTLGRPAAMAMPEDAAEKVLSALTTVDGITEHKSQVLSGPGGTTNSWYLGLAPSGAPRYAVVVVVEDSSEGDLAAVVGRSLLRNVLNPVRNP